jgi:hypothetical protein
MKKGKFFLPKNIYENCAFYGLDTELEPEPETELSLIKSWKQNRTITCQKSAPEPELYKLDTVPQHCFKSIEFLFRFLKVHSRLKSRKVKKLTGGTTLLSSC